MSLHAPFLVKQYLSTDIETGSYSKIFWYFPLDAASATQGGIGLFFEVVGGELADDHIYEQVVKRFWESFKDNFYVEGFEQALKKSVKMFIQLLRNFGVEEGLDVNISLLNVVEAGKGYMLKLISFGDSDIFVVREGKFADMGKMVPPNETLYDLKFLEVELDKGDVLMLGNKSLLRNAFENDLFALDGINGLIDSLENFKENLYGSNKIFLVAATDIADVKVQKAQTAKIVLTKAGGMLVNLLSKSKTFAERFIERIKKQKVATPLEPAIKPNETPPIWSTKNEEVVEEIDEIPTEKEPEVVENETEQVATTEEPEEKGFIVPPPVVDDESEEIAELSDLDEEKPDQEKHLVDPVEVLPGKKVTVDDFVVSEEITPAMKVDKSDYKDIVTGALEDIDVEEIAPEEESGKPNKYVESPTAPAKGKDFVNELRARRTPLGKLARHPATKAAIAALSGGIAWIWQQGMKLLGKEVQVGDKKLFLTRPAAIEKNKRIPPGFIIIFILVVLGLFFWIKSSLAQKKLEKELLSSYQSQVSAFSTFYDRSIAVIDTEDTERQLELCAPEAEKVYAKEKEVTAKLKSDKTKTAVAALTNQVRAKVAECQSKYDRIYGIIRVKDAELVTDFKVSLGNDSDISAISLRGTSIVVADKGRKAIYQVNVDTKSVIKLEDPLGLVVDPITVGTGEGTLFVCDKTNGVLYYSRNAAGSSEGFNRIVGAEPTSIGECAYVDGYAQNAYVVPNTANVVYKIVGKNNGGFETPFRYMKDLAGIKSITIDGNIYVVTAVAGKGDIEKYVGGVHDNFTLSQGTDLGELTASYTNPSAERNLYVYDKTKNAVLSIEKPNSKHPGRGVVEKTYLFENNDKFKDVKSFVIDLNVRNQEVNMYVLSGTTIWKVTL